MSVGMAILFDGSDDPEFWLQSMEDYFEDFNISMEEYVTICISCLRGEAANWAKENELIISTNWCAFCYNVIWKFTKSEMDIVSLCQEDSVSAQEEGASAILVGMAVTIRAEGTEEHNPIKDTSNVQTVDSKEERDDEVTVTEEIVAVQYASSEVTHLPFLVNPTILKNVQLNHGGVLCEAMLIQDRSHGFDKILDKTVCLYMLDQCAWIDYLCWLFEININCREAQQLVRKKRLLRYYGVTNSYVHGRNNKSLRSGVLGHFRQPVAGMLKNNTSSDYELVHAKCCAGYLKGRPGSDTISPSSVYTAIICPLVFDVECFRGILHDIQGTENSARCHRVTDYSYIVNQWVEVVHYKTLSFKSWVFLDGWFNVQIVVVRDLKFRHEKRFKCTRSHIVIFRWNSTTPSNHKSCRVRTDEWSCYTGEQIFAVVMVIMVVGEGFQFLKNGSTLSEFHSTCICYHLDSTTVLQVHITKFGGVIIQSGYAYLVIDITDHSTITEWLPSSLEFQLWKDCKLGYYLLSEDELINAVGRQPRVVNVEGVSAQTFKFTVQVAPRIISGYYFFGHCSYGLTWSREALAAGIDLASKSQQLVRTVDSEILGMPITCSRTNLHSRYAWTVKSWIAYCLMSFDLGILAVRLGSSYVQEFYNIAESRSMKIRNALHFLHLNSWSSLPVQQVGCQQLICKMKTSGRATFLCAIYFGALLIIDFDEYDVFLTYYGRTIDNKIQRQWAYYMHIRKSLKASRLTSTATVYWFYSFLRTNSRSISEDQTTCMKVSRHISAFVVRKVMLSDGLITDVVPWDHPVLVTSTIVPDIWLLYYFLVTHITKVVINHSTEFKSEFHLLALCPSASQSRMVTVNLHLFITASTHPASQLWKIIYMDGIDTAEQLTRSLKMQQFVWKVSKELNEEGSIARNIDLPNWCNISVSWFYVSPRFIFAWMIACLWLQKGEARHTRLSHRTLVGVFSWGSREVLSMLYILLFCSPLQCYQLYIYFSSLQTRMQMIRNVFDPRILGGFLATAANVGMRSGEQYRIVATTEIQIIPTLLFLGLAKLHSRGSAATIRLAGAVCDHYLGHYGTLLPYLWLIAWDLFVSLLQQIDFKLLNMASLRFISVPSGWGNLVSNTTYREDTSNTVVPTLSRGYMSSGYAEVSNYTTVPNQESVIIIVQLHCCMVGRGCQYSSYGQFTTGSDFAIPT